MIEVKALSTKGRLFRSAVTQGIAATEGARIDAAIPVIPESPFVYSQLLPG